MDWDTLELIELVVTLSVVPLAILAAYLDRRHRAKSASAWREVADHCDLHFLDRGAADQELEESYRGYKLRVSSELFKVEAGRSTQTCYVTTIAVNTLQAAVREARIDPREPYAHETGEWKATTKSFAAAFRQNDAEVTRWLADDPDLRHVMERVQAAGDNLELREGQVRRSRQHLFASFGELLKFINTTIELTSKIDARARQLIRAEDAPGEGKVVNSEMEEAVGAGASGGELW
ncbi:hypothetical protein FRC98_17185 [Lujinxingia vulgaris]|uniref:Uncharacterized protein n=1 Tax=Lujinxingia vulgaris TaxID=2600176 RepID=A0A5C6X7W9_9DELT|nr:hypothetical protein [Lujinxingia vulgaris]TXD35199.1 hypothetical protein FRC98_17185 [Lujinxingia vulgaris]